MSLRKTTAVILLIFLTTNAFAEDSEIEMDAEEKKTQEKAWSPSATENVWVQLTSGEWLKGEIKSMYNESLEFDSDKLNLLSIDFEDIKYLQTFRSTQVNIENMGSVRGKLNISEDVVSVGQGDKVKTFERIELVSFTPGGSAEIDLWAIKFTLGLDVKEGNTKQLDFTSKLSAKRRTAKSRFTADYIGNISSTNAINDELVETINNHRVNSKIDVYVTRYFFYTPLFIEYFKDEFQNIDYKVSAGVGIGYTMIDTDSTDWRISGGPSYVSTNYNSVQSGEDLEVDNGSIALGTVYETEINGALDFVFKYDTQISKEESGGYTHHMSTTLEIELTGKLDFDISFYWDRINSPTIDEDDNEPEKDDYRLVFGLSYTY